MFPITMRKKKEFMKRVSREMMDVKATLRRFLQSSIIAQMIFLFVIAFVIGMIVIAVISLSNNSSNALFIADHDQSKEAVENDLIISPLLHLTGGGATNMGLMRFLEENFVKLSTENALHDLTMIDVGVYDGKEAAQAVKKGFTVYGFEPINGHIHDIHKTFKENRLEQKMQFINLTKIYENEKNDIEAIKKYLNDFKNEWIPKQDGFLYLFQAAATENFGMTKMAAKGVFSQLDLRKEVSTKYNEKESTVITVPISSIVERDIMWFKSDSQGYETEVLKGAVDLFNNYKIDYIYIEYWPKEIKKIFGPNGIQDLLSLLRHDLKRKICYPSRKDEMRTASAKPMNVMEFESTYEKYENTQSGTFFEELICV